MTKRKRTTGRCLSDIAGDHLPPITIPEEWDEESFIDEDPTRTMYMAWLPNVETFLSPVPSLEAVKESVTQSSSLWRVHIDNDTGHPVAIDRIDNA